VAVYIRLSREDGRPDESESVANQRKLILEYLAALADGGRYVIAGEYVDDGISGTTDDEREAFQRMLEDIRLGLVNCVVVKDLARSFRNYSDQGYYLDDWFPRHSVRFISLSHQALDSYHDARALRNIAVPIQGVLNENHCAETSDKVREVLDMKRRHGEHIGAFALYGYRKAGKNTLEVDEEAAAVVRKIFGLFLDGMSKNAIVRQLNGEGILCPAAYKREQLGLRYQNPHVDPARHPLWSAQTVGRILREQMYCGDMVQGRFRMKSYKVHIQETVPREEWFLVENTHPPIISRETFAQVQALLEQNTRTAPRQSGPYLFAGLLRCADCGRAMSRSLSRGIVYYYCRTYKDRSKSACTRHSIRHDQLEGAVLYTIQRQIGCAVDFPQLLDRLSRVPAGRDSSGLEHTLAQRERELARLARYRQGLYQDWKDGALTRAEYQQMREDYEARIQAVHEALQGLRTRLAEVSPPPEDPLLASLSRHRTVERLTRDLVLQLVDHVRVYEGGRICVVFRFCPPQGACFPYETGAVGPVAPVAPVAPSSPQGPSGPVAPVAPVAPVGPVGPCMGEAASAPCIFAFRKSWFCTAVSSMLRTLSVAVSTSPTVAEGPLRPGRVPRIYCSFSPSALRIWLSPSSSMAMEERI